MKAAREPFAVLVTRLFLRLPLALCLPPLLRTNTCWLRIQPSTQKPRLFCPFPVHCWILFVWRNCWLHSTWTVLKLPVLVQREGKKNEQASRDAFRDISRSRVTTYFFFDFAPVVVEFACASAPKLRHFWHCRVCPSCGVGYRPICTKRCTRNTQKPTH